MQSRLQNPRMEMLQSQLRRFSVPKGERLDNEFFVLMLAVALLFHFAALYAWWLSPKTQVIDIPVRALSVKLGGEDMPTDDDVKAAQNNDNSKAVENTLSRLIRVEDKKTEKPKPAAKQPKAEPRLVPKSEKSVAAAAPKQYVREPSAQATEEAGKAPAGGKETRELLARYEQLISLWIQKFKQYPEEARRQGMQGETMVRIRIDRRGNIHYWALENSTGYIVLDRAAIDMVKRANPVPAVPNDYPEGEQFDFLIPVNFRLE